MLEVQEDLQLGPAEGAYIRMYVRLYNVPVLRRQTVFFYHVRKNVQTWVHQRQFRLLHYLDNPNILLFQLEVAKYQAIPCKYRRSYIRAYRILLNSYSRIQAVQNAHSNAQFWQEEQSRINIERQKLELKQMEQQLELQELEIVERRRKLQETGE